MEQIMNSYNNNEIKELIKRLKKDNISEKNPYFVTFFSLTLLNFPPKYGKMGEHKNIMHKNY